MRRSINFLAATAILFSNPLAVSDQNSFVQVRGQQFILDHKPYYFIGANFWTAMNLGTTSVGRERLVRELDRLKNLGVRNLRILGGSEGPDNEPWRIAPALQKKPGQLDESLLTGLDFVLSEMQKRNMRAVVCLNNFWHWSGGMSQYLQWAGAGNIPYPPPHPNGSWNTFQIYTSQFYSNEAAIRLSETFMRKLITRTNSITGDAYVNDPSIMAWELANEPRGMLNRVAFNKWISRTAKLIKSLDQNHLVTTGSEGETPFGLYAGMNFIENHSDPNIDYATAHIWAQNFGWYDPLKPSTYESAVSKAKAYLQDHQLKAAQLGKPLVIEEFGLARDGGSYDPTSTLTYRDRYFEVFFQALTTSALSKSVLAGVNFWAWAGEATPKSPYGSPWLAGDPLTGDPPHEPQGWYSVYATDASTLKLLSEYTQELP